MSTNPVNMRLPLAIHGKAEPEVVQAVQYHDDAITDLQQAIPLLKAQIDAKANAASTSTTNTSSTASTVTTAQATTIANTQAQTVVAQTFGVVNPQTGTAYTAQTGDYGGLISFNSAAPVAATLNSTVASQWFTAMENLGAGTVTVTPDSGLINGLASIPLVTGAGALIYRNPDGVNWNALTVPAPSVASGVTSLDGITGAVALVAGTGITITDNSPSAGDITIAASAAGVSSLQGETGALTLTSSGATVVITTPTSSTINLESTGGGGLPTNNPTFTGVLTGPKASINHFLSTGTPPSVTLHGAAGSGATVNAVVGNDSIGVISITTGTGTSTGNIFDITFGTLFTSYSASIIQSVDVPAGTIANVVGVDFGGAAQKVFSQAAALTSSHNYEFRYFIFGD